MGVWQFGHVSQIVVCPYRLQQCATCTCMSATLRRASSSKMVSLSLFMYADVYVSVCVHVATRLYWQVNRLRAGMNLARLNVLLPD